MIDYLGQGVVVVVVGLIAKGHERIFCSNRNVLEQGTGYTGISICQKSSNEVDASYYLQITP